MHLLIIRKLLVENLNLAKIPFLIKKKRNALIIICTSALIFLLRYWKKHLDGKDIDRINSNFFIKQT